MNNTEFHQVSESRMGDPFRLDGWFSGFTSDSTVFQSYPYCERVIMKGAVCSFADVNFAFLGPLS